MVAAGTGIGNPGRDNVEVDYGDEGAGVTEVEVAASFKGEGAAGRVYGGNGGVSGSHEWELGPTGWRDVEEMMKNGEEVVGCTREN